jgi:hypothetical protein
MAMLLGPANGSIMVRHVLDVREGVLPSNHTIPTLNFIPHLKNKKSKIKMLGRRVIYLTRGTFYLPT